MHTPKWLYILIISCSGLFSINAYSESFLSDMQDSIKANAPAKPASDSSIKNSLQSVSDATKPSPNQVDKLNLPVNVADKDIVLLITIPDGLKLSTSQPGNPSTMVFKDKSNVLVVSNQTGGKYQARTMIANGVARLQKDYKVTVLKSAEFINPGFEDSYFFLKLVNPKKNSTQFVFYFTISGPFDSAAIYFYKTVQSGEDPDTVADKVNELFNKHVTVVQTLKKDSDIPFYKEPYPVKIHVYDTVHEF